MTFVSPTSLPNPNSLKYKTKDPGKCKTTIGTNAFPARRIFRFSGLPFFRLTIVSDIKPQASLLFRKRRISANTSNV